MFAANIKQTAANAERITAEAPSAKLAVPSPSLRPHRTKFLQRILIALARSLQPAISGDQASVTLEVMEDDVAVYAWPKAPSYTPAQQTEILAAAALVRDRIFAFSGCCAFRLTTQKNVGDFTPLALEITTPDGVVLRPRGSGLSATLAKRRCAELSDILDCFHLSARRGPSDLDALLEKTIQMGEDPSDLKSKWTIIMPGATVNDDCESLRDIFRERRTLLPGLHTATQMTGPLADAVQSMATVEELYLDDPVHPGRYSGAVPTTFLEDSLETVSRAGAPIYPNSRSLKLTSAKELLALAEANPLLHLAVEFGCTEPTLRSHLRRHGWTPPRAKS